MQCVIEYRGRYSSWVNALPVGQVPVTLGSLSSEVGQVAGEKEVVRGRNGEGVAHESSGIDDQGAGHRAGDTIMRVVRIGDVKMGFMWMSYP